jgi:hypothetical protein
MGAPRSYDRPREVDHRALGQQSGQRQFVTLPGERIARSGPSN